MGESEIVESKHMEVVSQKFTEVSTRLSVLEVKTAAQEIRVGHHEMLIEAMAARQNALETAAAAQRELSNVVREQSAKQDGQILYLQQQAVDTSKLLEKHDHDIERQVERNADMKQALDALQKERDSKRFSVTDVLEWSAKIAVTGAIGLIIAYLFNLWIHLH